MGMKISIGVAVALMLGAVVWPATAVYELLARVAICAVALTGALRSARTDRYASVFGLTAIAVLFNPILPFALPPPFMLVAMAVCLTGLAAWLVVLERTAPVPSVAQVLHPLDGVR